MAAGTDIFISYKREELVLAEAYATAFRAKGLLVVTDLNLPEGERFGKAIDTMICEATGVVARIVAPLISTGSVPFQDAVNAAQVQRL